MNTTQLSRYFLSIAFFCLTLLSADDSGPGLSEKEKAYLESLPSLKVPFIHHQQPPITFSQNGRPTGFLNDLLDTLSQKLGLEIERIHSDNLGTSYEALKSGEADMLIQYSEFGQKQNFALSTEPVLTIPFVAVGRSECDPVLDVRDLDEKKVVLVKHFQQTRTIQNKYPELDVILVNNLDKVYPLLRAGKADYYIDHAVHAGYRLKEQMISDLKIAGELPWEEMGALQYRIAIQKSMPLLHRAIQKTLDSMKGNEMLSLKSKWVPQQDESRIKILNAKEKEYLKKLQLRVAYTDNWFPFQFLNKDEKPLGIALDYWKIINKTLNLQVINQGQRQFSEILEEMESGTLDIHFSTAKTKEREKYALFSKPYDHYPIAIAAEKSVPFISNASLLLGKPVAVGKNFSAYHLLREKYPGIDFIQVSNTAEALKLVKQGKAFAAVDILPTLQFLMNNHDFDALKIAGVTDVQFDLRVMIGKEHAPLLPLINRAIDKIDEDDRRKVYSKWMLYPVIKQIDYSLIWQILAIVIIVLFASLYWIQRLKKEITQRQNAEHGLKVLNDSLQQQVDEQVAKHMAVLKEQEEQKELLIQQSKMAAMGEMMSSIAHQWRQPINSIGIMAQEIEILHDDGELNGRHISENVQGIVGQVQYMSKTIDDFRNFFKPDKTKKWFHIQDVFSSAKKLMSAQMAHSIISLEYNGEAIEIYGYESEFQQVLMNLFHNSRDAINTRKKSLPCLSGQIEVTTHTTASNCEIIIKDNGGGIPQEILDKIFDPYFTTKFESQGTGLGLYMSKMIIEKNMNGILSVVNTDDGAEFTISLPLEGTRF